MNKKRLSLVLILVIMLRVIYPYPMMKVDAGVDTDNPRRFTESQQRNADRIAEVCIKEWENYGVLPSIAISQAFIESTLGDHCRGYNLWGISSGKASYNSLDSGIYGYLRVINNGYYPNAPFQRDYKVQIREILDGGYCQPEGEYYNKVLWTVEEYNLTRYDEELFKSIDKNKRDEFDKKTQSERERLKNLSLERADTEYMKKRVEKQYKKCYEFVYDPNVSEYKVSVDISLIYGGCILAYDELELVGIYDIEGGDIEGYYIGTRDKSLVGKLVYLDIREEAVR